MAREKNITKKEKTNKEEDDSSIASLLREMRADIKNIKSDNKEMKINMQQMNQEIVSIETKQKESDENTASELVSIHREIEDGKEAMQDAVATKVLDQLKPVIEEKLVNTVNAEDVKKII